MANFAVHWNHETTVGSQIKILTSFARDFSSTAQHIVYTSESSIQRSEQSVSAVTLKLLSSTIRNTLTHWLLFYRIFHLLLHLDQKFKGNVFTAAPVSWFIFTH